MPKPIVSAIQIFPSNDNHAFLSADFLTLVEIESTDAAPFLIVGDTMSTRHDLYKDGVDFTTLALQSPDFAKYLKPNNQLDFTDPNAVRQLTVSLLQRDFDLKVDIPEARLCPPVPNRLNYILWLQDLIDTTGDEYRDEYNSDRKVTGLDIGTGCCSIYPLLGTSMRPNWSFLATDIDHENVRTATHTVKSNDLESRIHVVKTIPSDNLISINLIPGAER
ncbi:Putative DUF890 domain protein [Aspergillus calidoustus]|uniref:Putative DUF890 domain protein n=1 Tax=Aspergillus calidoustus TaxID=454130 RepID=A0A0U4ZYX0_ASPCI|nr:Putative DUF890 domain protein [Aspergillus calidoustus]